MTNQHEVVKAARESGLCDEILNEAKRLFPIYRGFDSFEPKLSGSNKPVGIREIQLDSDIVITNRGTEPARFVPLECKDEDRPRLAHQDWMIHDASLRYNVKFKNLSKGPIEVEARGQAWLSLSATLRLEPPDPMSCNTRMKADLLGGQGFTRFLCASNSIIDGLQFQADLLDGNKRFFSFALRVTQGQEKFDEVKMIDTNSFIEKWTKVQEVGTEIILKRNLNSSRDI
jgi:hypothetical protein